MKKGVQPEFVVRERNELRVSQIYIFIYFNHEY